METRKEDLLSRAKEQQNSDEKRRPRPALTNKAGLAKQSNTDLLPVSTPSNAGASATSKWNPGLIRSTIVEMSDATAKTQNNVLADAYSTLQKDLAAKTLSGEASLSAALICGPDVQVAHIGSTRLILLSANDQFDFTATRLTFDHLYTKMDDEELGCFNKKRLNNYNTAIENETSHQSGIHVYTRLLGNDKILNEPHLFGFTIPESSSAYLLAVTSELTKEMQEKNIAGCINNNRDLLQSSENKAQSIAELLSTELHQRNSQAVATVLAIDLSKQNSALPTLCYVTEGRESIELAEHLNATLKEHVVEKFNEHLALEKAEQQAETEKEVTPSSNAFTLFGLTTKQPAPKAVEEAIENTSQGTVQPAKRVDRSPINVPGGSGSCRIC